MKTDKGVGVVCRLVKTDKGVGVVCRLMKTDKGVGVVDERHNYEGGHTSTDRQTTDSGTSADNTGIDL